MYMVQMGPAWAWVRSRTLMPSSALLDISPKGPAFDK